MGESGTSAQAGRPPRQTRGSIGRGLHLLDTGIARVEAIVLAYGVLLMAANSCANVIGRFVFGRSIYFTGELNQFLMVLITFIGLGYAARNGRHIRMSALYDQLPDFGRKILMIIIAAVTSAMMFVLAYYSFRYVERIWTLGKITPSLGVPLYLTYIWVPVGFVVTGVQYLMTVIRNLTSSEIYISYEKVDDYEDTDETEAAV